MGKLLKHSSLILSCFFLTGCSVYKAASQPGPADLTGIGVGTPRLTIISRLGAPKMIDNDVKGHKQDIFEFQSGLHQLTKARVALYITADFFSFALAEFALWPLELTLIDSATCIGVAQYDDDLKIVSWMVTDKKNSMLKC